MEKTRGYIFWWVSQTVTTKTLREGLQVCAVVASDERDLVIAVEILDLGQEVLNLVGLLHADAVS